MSKHTPEPWHAVLQSAFSIETLDGHQLCFIRNGADARLIAAAPELLEALQWFVDELPSIIRQCCPSGVPLSVANAHDKARAAILKVTGGK